jgi:mono/diheme cytochrome c family protein
MMFAMVWMLITAMHPSAEGQRKTPPAPAPAAAPQDSGLPAGNVQHGQYLAEHVAMCIECHSPRDEAGRLIESERYLGGNIPFSPPWPNDWATRAPRNRGLVGYDDKAALRLLTEGAIGREGRRLRAPMPRFFMTRQDAADVIAFLRSLH